MRCHRLALALALLLAGCTGIESWSKAGIDAAATAGEYQNCRAAAAGAVKTDADIDQDILATRQNDWQRSGVGRVQTQTVRDHTRDRAGSIIDACMRAKGFTQPP